MKQTKSSLDLFCEIVTLHQAVLFPPMKPDPSLPFGPLALSQLKPF